MPDASIVLKVAANTKHALVYVCDACHRRAASRCEVSAPAGIAWICRPIPAIGIGAKPPARTDSDGLLKVDLHHSPIDVQLFVAARLKDRQTFTLANTYYRSSNQSDNPDETWRIYATTDRPAYRPGETAQWKFIARKYNGSVYSTPSDQTVVYRIDDPRGTKVKEDTAKLNTFGSAWNTVDLTETMPLGEYHVTFWDENKKHVIGNATLFRLEEYKLPEFKVSVQTPEEQRQKEGIPRR